MNQLLLNHYLSVVAVAMVRKHLRFGVRQSARQTAVSAVAGFAVLCLAVLGGELPT